MELMGVQMKEQKRNSSSFLHRAVACNHTQLLILIVCQINTKDNKYKGKMIAVVYLEKVVCEAHDINFAFSVRNFTSKHPKNNEQGRA